MGWASGSELAEDLWSYLKSRVTERDKRKIARKIIELFERQDCDTIDECEELCRAAGRMVDDDGEVSYR